MRAEGLAEVKWYLAGPMTGIPKFNFPAFDAACIVLRADGHEVISPHEQDSPAVQAAARNSPDGKLHGEKIAGETWAEILAKDVILVGDKVGGIVFLPNWHKSRGAKLEAFVGLLTGKRFALYEEGTVIATDADYIRSVLAENMP